MERLLPTCLFERGGGHQDVRVTILIEDVVVPDNRPSILLIHIRVKPSSTLVDMYIILRH
jgi:hypothetical protein